MPDKCKDFFVWLFTHYDSALLEIRQLLLDNGNVFDTSPWSNIISHASIQNTTKSICISIAIICFLIEFIKILLNNEVLNEKVIIKVLIKYCFARVGMELVNYFLDAIQMTGWQWLNNTIFGSGALLHTSDLAVGSHAYTQQVKDAMDGMGLLEWIPALLFSGISMIIINLSVVVIKVLVYARAFEICVLWALAYVPCAFIPLEGGAGGRLVKSYLLNFGAVCLQGYVMGLCLLLFSRIANTLVTDATTLNEATTSLLLATILLLVGFAKSGSFASKILSA